MSNLFQCVAEEIQKPKKNHPRHHKFRSQNLGKLLDIQGDWLYKNIKDVGDEIKMTRGVLTDQRRVLQNFSYHKRSKISSLCSTSRSNSRVTLAFLILDKSSGSPGWQDVTTASLQVSIPLLENAYLLFITQGNKQEI